jgi:hypothetical protein
VGGVEALLDLVVARPEHHAELHGHGRVAVHEAREAQRARGQRVGREGAVERAPAGIGEAAARARGAPAKLVQAIELRQAALELVGGVSHSRRAPRSSAPRSAPRTFVRMRGFSPAR